MTDTRSRAIQGTRMRAAFGWGVVATVAMTAVMGVTVITGVSPLPKPIPAALVARTVGPLPMPVLMASALLAHLAYGGLGAMALAGLTRRINLRHGVLWGGALWVLAGLVWMPYLGWGIFGLRHAAAIAVATLVLHLLYGAVLGLLGGRSEPASE